MTFFIFVNLAAGLAVFWFACGELDEKKRLLTQPSAWIYAVMAVTALAVALDGLVYERAHHPTEVLFNTIVAMHFVRKMWQEREKEKAEQAEAAPPEPQPSQPKPKPAKPNRRTRRKRRR